MYELYEKASAYLMIISWYVVVVTGFVIVVSRVTECGEGSLPVSVFRRYGGDSFETSNSSRLYTVDQWTQNQGTCMYNCIHKILCSCMHGSS